MNRRWRKLLATVVLMLVMTVSLSAAAFASDDNSLADLGIKTPGATVSPDFKYDIWEYSVEVPAGTEELELAPHTTNPNATVNSVTGTTLTDGAGTVVITVTSESGNAIEYVLNVTQARGDVDPAEAIAANEGMANATLDTEIVLQSEVETEDPRYVKVDRNSLEDAEKTIEKLQKTITEQRSHISMMTYVLYALIAVSIIFLFIVISQLLRRRDMAQELAMYRQGDPYRSGEGYVAEDGWGEWGEEDAEHSHKKKKKNKKQAPVDDDWGEEPANPASSWADEQIGTPMQPSRPSQKSYPAGDQRQSRRGKNPQKSSRTRQNNGSGQRPNGNTQRAGGNASRQNTQRVNNGQRMNGNTQRSNGNTPRQGSQQRVNGNGQRANSQQRQGSYDETRRYQAVQPVHADEVPRDVTKDLTRMNKAEQKAMKKAAAAEAKHEQEVKRAQKAREAEAKRQAMEAERLAKEQAAAREAQEEALRQAAAQRVSQEAEQSAKASAPKTGKDKNVKIDMIDL